MSGRPLKWRASVPRRALAPRTARRCCIRLLHQAAASGGPHPARHDKPPAASQLAARMVTFGMNLLVARHLTPEAYGVGPVALAAALSAQSCSCCMPTDASHRTRQKGAHA